MQHTEYQYIQAGYRFQRGIIPFKRVEMMLAKETEVDRTLALFLFNRGRLEATNQ
jgi:hypothetical protein